MNKIKVILIGAGLRGITYTDAMSETDGKYEVVAVAEPIKSRRDYIKNKHSIPDNMCFDDWKPLLALGKIADAAVIATMDRQHFEPAIAAIKLKYDILLEKPISDNPGECVKIANLAEKNNVKVVICTVLRYTPIFTAIKDITDDGKIGTIMSVNHEECVGNIHQSHSFVRGNWGNSKRSSCMLLQKSCHDMDILQWIIGGKLKKIQSFGSLTYFTPKNAPAGAPDYCIEGCPNGDTCYYNAVKLYYDDKQNEWFRSAATHIVNATDDQVKDAISKTQYGKCVFKCDNDVVDHQTVNMLFDNDVTVTFTMNAFNKGGRYIHIMGTKGELHAAMDGGEPIKIYSFDTKKTTQIPITAKDGIANGHGGGDRGIVEAFYDYVCGIYTGKAIPDIKQAADNHLIVFAAEKSRIENITVDFDEYRKSFIDNTIV